MNHDEILNQKMFSSSSTSSKSIFSIFLAALILASVLCFNPPRQQVSRSPGKLLYLEAILQQKLEFLQYQNYDQFTLITDFEGEANRLSENGDGAKIFEQSA